MYLLIIKKCFTQPSFPIFEFSNVPVDEEHRLDPVCDEPPPLKQLHLHPGHLGELVGVLGHLEQGPI